MTPVDAVIVGDAAVTIARDDLRGPSGTTLAGTVTRPDGREPRGTVLLPATYGKQQEAFCALSVSLALNGWRVVKFDLRNNEGASPGGIGDFCFLTMVQDIEAAARHAREQYGAYSLVASSLAARAAIRALPVIPSPICAAFIMPVVHAGSTVDEASKARPYEKWVSGRDRDLMTGDVVDGFMVKRGFIARAIDADLLSQTGTERELAILEQPVWALFSRDDAWIRAEEAEWTFAQANRHRAATDRALHQVHFVEGVSHELGKNPVMFREVLTLLCGALSGAEQRVDYAPFRLIAQGVRTERQLLRGPATKDFLIAPVQHTLADAV